MENKSETLADYGKFGKIEKVDLQEVFNESVLLAAACFHPSSLVAMEDGTNKSLASIEIGDITKVGGKVYMKLESISNDLYLLDDILVSGNHAVFDEEGRGEWIYVKDFSRAKSVPGACQVISIATENHVIKAASGKMYSDYYMTDNFSNLLNKELLYCIQKELPASKLAKLGGK